MRTRPWLLAPTVVFLAACLGADSRPEPGSLLVTASSDAALQNGFTTEDGWTIRYDRFVVSLGHASPEGESCTFYSDTAYNRVLDMRIPRPQKLSIIYALGHCKLDYEVSSPVPETVLGENITAVDRDFMRTPASDDIARDAGVSIFVDGIARKGQVEKRFQWSFRNRVEYAGCSATIDGKLVEGADFRSSEAISRAIVVHGATLFQDRLEGSEAALAFEPFALADERGDRDGQVTLSELDKMPLMSPSKSSPYADGEASWTTLEEYVYLGLFKKVVRYQGNGSCEESSVFANERAAH